MLRYALTAGWLMVAIGLGTGVATAQAPCSQARTAAAVARAKAARDRLGQWHIAPDDLPYEVPPAF
ncbi:MAG TPA: hypothetical protein VFP94_07315, partial [Terriglobales bacterium]|nr:hypothetical protein [Terriglobales bacterium]